MRKRKWIWLFLWILSLVGISFYGGAVSYGLFWSLLLVPVVSFSYLLYVYLRFRIYQEIESRQVICGQPSPYYFGLRNEDKLGFASIQVRMFPDYSYVENVAEEVEYELLPGDEVLYRSRIICKYRGEYEVGVKEVILTDFFGIFRFRYPVPGAIWGIVKPRLVSVLGLSALEDVVVNLERESYLAQNEPDVVVRGYVPGDSLKKIHWKNVARTGELCVRKDKGTEKQGILLVFDTCRYSQEMAKYLPLESKMLECLLALALFWAEKNTQISVCYRQNDVQRVDITGMKDFEDFYMRTADMTFQNQESSKTLLEWVVSQGAVWDAKVLVCVFHEWTEAMMELAERVVASGVSVIAYVVTDDNLEEYIKYNTDRQKVIPVSITADLEGVL